MACNQQTKKTLAVSILSLSLLTVMAGAAVAPALNIIGAYFSDADPLFVQMIISVPAIFIVITNFFFSRLCELFNSRVLTLAGLLFYTAGGCLAGVFNNIFALLITRAFVGIGVGIIMPLSTGLLAYYFLPEQQEKLMGYSSAMNQLGGVIATLLSGMLAGISWRASFLVYLLGLISIILCLLFLPSDKISQAHSSEKIKVTAVFKSNYTYIIAMFLLMTIFFIYPANFAMETIAEGIIPQKYIAVIMAAMDFIAFAGGLSFVSAKKILKSKTKFLAPLLFLAGYLLLLINNVFGILAGSALIGFANGAGIPFIISEASSRAGKSAVTTVMPLISASLYLAQFLCPVIMSAISSAVSASLFHLPYLVAVVLAVIFCFWSALLPEKN